MFSKFLSRKFFSTAVPRLWINKDSCVICQGMTGKEVPIFLSSFKTQKFHKLGYLPY